MPLPRAILFDLDGTLLDNSGAQASIARTCEVITAQRPGLAASALLEANARAWPRLWKDVEAGWLLGECSTTAIVVSVWDTMLRACGCNDPMLALIAAR